MDLLQKIDIKRSAILGVVAAHRAHFVRIIDRADSNASFFIRPVCIVVEPVSDMTLLELHAMQNALSELLGEKADVMTPSMLPAYARVGSTEALPMESLGANNDRQIRDGVALTLRAIERISRYTEHLTEQAFMQDELAQDAVARNLSIISTAVLGVTDVPGIARDHPTLEPWYEILATALAGDYDVDWRVIWVTTQRALPHLHVEIHRVLSEMNPTVDLR